MTDPGLEWNVAFPPEEVIPRLENLFRQYHYPYTREQRDAERHYRTALGQGTLEVVVQPREPEQSPLSRALVLRRTRLQITYQSVSGPDQARFKHQLTLAFLRVGG